MGFNVDCVNTVSLSNHPDYRSGCQGKGLAPEDFTAILNGLNANNLLHYDMIISGYIR